MRLALVNLTRGGLSGGYQKYLQEVLPRFNEHPLIRELKIFAHPNFVDKLSNIASGLDISPCKDTLAGRRILQRELTIMAPDVVFFPSLRGIVINGAQTIYMIRNMEPLALPLGGNSCREAMKNLARKFAAKSACQRSNRVLAVSLYVKDFLVTTWNINPTKIGVVYHGADDRLSQCDNVKPANIPGELQGGFLFTAGSIRPARGLEDVIQALAELSAAGQSLFLVIAGSADHAGSSYERRMKRLANKLGVWDKIVWTGHLTPEEMSWCYTRAELFIMTSRVEACPNIALESMSHGCGCIAADNPPLPEFFRNCASYYNPGDYRMLANSIAAYQLTAAETKKLMHQQALARAKEFTWDKTAAETVSQFKMMLGA